MNAISKVREDISEFFEPNGLLQDSHETSISPSKNFRLETSVYSQSTKDLDWEVTKVELFENSTNKEIFSFFANTSDFFHAWLEKENLEYLVCAEDLFGGQTIIDLTNRKMASYSPGNDGFIWTAFYLSPDGNKLAAVGCYWGCNYDIKIYDFKSPLDLPLVELNEFELLGNNEEISRWTDNNTLMTDRRHIQI